MWMYCMSIFLKDVFVKIAIFFYIQQFNFCYFPKAVMY